MSDAADRWYLSGPLGIGIIEPRRKLDVDGEIVATNRLTLAQDGGSTKTTWHLDNAGGRLRIFDQPNIDTGGTERLTITAAGNVGIGTATPTTATGGRALHVHNPSGPSALRLGNGGSNGQEWEWQSTVIANNGALNLSNLTGMNNPLTVLANGNVGIGTTTPTDKLDTAGSVRILTNSNPLRFTSAWSGFPDAASNQAEISNDTVGHKTLMIVGNRSAGVGRRVSVWDRLEVNGTFAILGLTRDDLARSILDTLPSYSVIIGVEDRSQGTFLVFYWRDGNGQRRKGWVSWMPGWS